VNLANRIFCDEKHAEVRDNGHKGSTDLPSRRFQKVYSLGATLEIYAVILNIISYRWQRFKKGFKNESRTVRSKRL
jgi:hypothetical protein